MFLSLCYEFSDSQNCVDFLFFINFSFSDNNCHGGIKWLLFSFVVHHVSSTVINIKNSILVVTLCSSKKYYCIVQLTFLKARYKSQLPGLGVSVVHHSVINHIHKVICE